MAVNINADDCIACGSCVNDCPVDALTLGDVVEVNDDCIECGACTASCPVDALSL